MVKAKKLQRGKMYTFFTDIYLDTLYINHIWLTEEVDYQQI